MNLTPCVGSWSNNWQLTRCKVLSCENYTRKPEIKIFRVLSILNIFTTEKFKLWIKVIFTTGVFVTRFSNFQFTRSVLPTASAITDRLRVLPTSSVKSEGGVTPPHTPARYAPANEAQAKNLRRLALSFDQGLVKIGPSSLNSISHASGRAHIITRP